MPRSMRAPHRSGGRHRIELLEQRILLSTTWIVSSTADDGTSGTLRYEIANSVAGDVIQFDPNVFAPGSQHTITLASGQLEIAHDLTIQGPGPAIVAISGNSLSTVIQVDAGTQLTASGFTITKGSGKTASTGGGITDLGSLNLSNCTFSANSAASTGGAILATSGSPSGNTMIVTLSGCTFSSNSAGQTGGAVYMMGGNLNVSSSTFTSNTAPQGGGAIDGEGSTNALNVAGSTFASNSAAIGSGGAILANLSQFHIVNSTFTANLAHQGGGINSGGATVTITNCTVAGNSTNAANGGGIYLANPVSGIAAQIANTIVANNTHSVTGVVSQNQIDPVATWVTGSYDLVGQGDAGGLLNGVAGNLVGVANPGLAPLGKYGGPTSTMALMPGSPALDAGSNALAVDATGSPLTTDQRGLSRVWGQAVDIGAYEAQPPPVMGDVNHDGTVNLADLLILVRDFGKVTPLYEGGDLDGNGTVGLSDFLTLVRNFGNSTPASVAVTAPQNTRLAARRVA